MEKLPALDKALAAVAAGRSRKAEDALLLDLRGLASFTDYFVIMTGHNSRQIQAIADAVQESLREQGVRPLHVEGLERAEWVLLDYASVVVHVFMPATRAHYGLERLWHDAPVLPTPESPQQA